MRAAHYAHGALSRVLDDPRVVAAVGEWLDDPDRDVELRELIGELVFDELRLSYVWLADWLEMIVFWIHESRTPVAFEVQVFGIPPTNVRRRRHGPLIRVKAPKGGPAAIDQDITYWYRHRVAQNTATISALARELRTGQGGGIESDGRATIRAAINRTERILQSIGAGGLGCAYIKLDILRKC